VITPIDLAVSPDGSTLYASEFGAVIRVIDTGTNQVVTSIAFGDRSDGGLALSPDGKRLYVPEIDTGNQPDTIVVIDTATRSVVDQIPVGVRVSPTGLALNPAGTRLYVANEDGGTVSVIDTSTRVVIATLRV